MKGWWCVRYGDALAWVETPSEAAAVRRSLELHPLGDRTDDARQLAVSPRTRTRTLRASVSAASRWSDGE